MGKIVKEIKQAEDIVKNESKVWTDTINISLKHKLTDGKSVVTIAGQAVAMTSIKKLYQDKKITLSVVRIALNKIHEEMEKSVGIYLDEVGTKIKEKSEPYDKKN